MSNVQAVLQHFARRDAIHAEIAQIEEQIRAFDDTDLRGAAYRAAIDPLTEQIEALQNESLDLITSASAIERALTTEERAEIRAALAAR